MAPQMKKKKWSIRNQLAKDLNPCQPLPSRTHPRTRGLVTHLSHMYKFIFFEGRRSPERQPVRRQGVSLYPESLHGEEGEQADGDGAIIPPIEAQGSNRQHRGSDDSCHIVLIRRAQQRCCQRIVNCHNCHHLFMPKTGHLSQTATACFMPTH
jgi:hypothetical protein